MTDTRDDIDADPVVLQGLAQAVPQVEPPPALRARVLSSVQKQPLNVGEVPLVEADRRGDAVDRRVSKDSLYVDSEYDAPSERRKGPGPMVAWLAAAASLALAAGLGLYATQLKERVAALETDLRDATVRADASQRQIADAQRASSRAESAVAVLTAPDVARVDLAGQSAAPTAAARAFWSRSRGMVFTGTNLPQLPPGRTYQLWVVTAQAPISAGLLKPDPQGSVSGTFATPIDMPAPVAMAVTIEPDGGVPAPTGDKYLVGSL